MATKIATGVYKEVDSQGRVWRIEDYRQAWWADDDKREFNWTASCDDLIDDEFVSESYKTKKECLAFIAQF